VYSSLLCDLDERRRRDVCPRILCLDERRHFLSTRVVNIYLPNGFVSQLFHAVV
jgi:hypothetical protein